MLDGQGTMEDLARMLRLLARGVVVDRTALREQLGLKLEPATIERDTLIVDRIERPSAD